MPITKSAKKALRQSLKKRTFNLRRKRVMKEVLKEAKKLKLENKKDEALTLVPKAFKAIDKAAKRGIIKKGAAARKKSRLVKSLKK